MTTIQLPETAAAYVRAVNGGDPAALLALFADGAVVDDAGREFRGRDAIRAWAASDIFAVNVSLDVLDASGDVLTTKVDGTFDRTGLPDPVVIAQRFAVEGGKIVGLTCRLAGPA
jgi:hypothetical protein